jgi:hypothetical protein
MTPMIKVHFQLEPIDGYPPAAVESLWATEIEEGFRLENIPFYVNSVAFGDVVRVRVDESKNLFFEEVLVMSGNGTLHVFVSDSNQVQELRDELKLMGCDSERNKRHVAVDVPAHVNYAPIRAFLDKKEGDGELTYAEACLPG